MRCLTRVGCRERSAERGRLSLVCQGEAGAAVRRHHDALHHPHLLALPDDFLTATGLDTAHGRCEHRQMTANGLLVSHTAWLSAKQVSRLQRRTLMEDGSWRERVA